MRVDAHQHFWLLAERGADWPPPALAAIYRDHCPADLQPLLERHQIDATVLVQSRAAEADTGSLLALASQHGFIGAVVGWTDLKAAAAPERIAQLAAHPALKGLRPMLQDLPGDWLDDAVLDPAIAAMQAHGLSFDALVPPHQLAALLRFAQRHPLLPIVIDHAAKPPIGSAAMQQWRAALAQFGALPQVMCKLSGLLTEAPSHCDSALLEQVVRHVLQVFTPQRVMWGSDWPVLNLVADYASWFSSSIDLLDHLSADERAAVMGANAARFYRLA